jgi:hypothetical protein
MNQKLKQLIYGTLLLGGGLFSGEMIGAAQADKETSGELAELYYRGASTNLNLHLKLLDLLQSNEKEKVIGKLEVLIDCDLIALADYSNVPANLRSPEILKPIEKAKMYREKHPSASTSPEVNAAINKALDLVK